MQCSIVMTFVKFVRSHNHRGSLANNIRERGQNWPWALETLRSNQVRKRGKSSLNQSLTCIHTLLSPTLVEKNWVGGISPLSPLQFKSTSQITKYFNVCPPCLCGLVVRVSGYRYRGLGFDSRRYQIFWVVVGLERGPLSLVRSIEELLE